MALRVNPPGEDGVGPNTRGLPISFSAPGTPPGIDGILRAREQAQQGWENAAAAHAGELNELADGTEKNRYDYLELVRIAEQQAQLYTQQVNRRAWSQTYRAFHNEHYVGSKYMRPEWRNRSRLFVPKTRGAVRKDMAAVAASLFNVPDAVTCAPGDESDPRQRAAAAVMQELVNYRTDRQSGKAALPWFLLAMGARQDAMLTGICLSKQYWKHEFRKVSKEEIYEDDGTGTKIRKMRDVWQLEIDRPDMRLFPPENFVMDPAAPWDNPVQGANYILLKYPMTTDEIRKMMDAPLNPWHSIEETAIRQAVNLGKQDMEAVRRAREMGLDRFDETQTGSQFQIVWVYETFMRLGGEDWTFWSIGDKYFLTDPALVREVYPEQFGERPLAYGYANLESHRIYPMSPVESWQPLQVQVNDLRNLQLDAVKQNVMPISKVRRGKRIDLDQVKRRSSGSSIFVDDPTDVTWESPPAMPQDSVLMARELDLELDDLAGQQNYSNVENNNALGRTLGGLRLAAGAANAVQEFDIRVWIETWAAPALAQIVRLEQYYESDPIILGLCGQRAQLFQKYGINRIDDQLLEQQVTVQVSVGLGAGDPQQRLAKFQAAAQVLEPLLQGSPEFQSGQVEINWEEIAQEILGAVGYREGGMRFFKVNSGPRPNPAMNLKTQEAQARIAKDQHVGRAAYLHGLANLAKVALGKRDLEADVLDRLLDKQLAARKIGFEHADRHHQTHLAALDHGHRHGMAIASQRREMLRDLLARDQQEPVGEDTELEGAAPAPGAPSAAPTGSASVSSPPVNDAAIQALQALRGGQLNFVRDPRTGRITGVRMPQQQITSPQPQDAAAMRQQMPPVPQPPAAASSAAGPDIQHERRLAQLEEMIAQLSKPRRRRVVRDRDGKIVGIEDAAA